MVRPQSEQSSDLLFTNLKVFSCISSIGSAVFLFLTAISFIFLLFDTLLVLSYITQKRENLIRKKKNQGLRKEHVRKESPLDKLLKGKTIKIGKNVQSNHGTNDTSNQDEVNAIEAQGQEQHT